DWLAGINGHRPGLRLPLRVPHRERVGARRHVFDLVMAIAGRRCEKRVLEHDDVAFHLRMDATELHIYARRLQALAEHVVFRLPLWPRTKIVLLIIGRKDVVLSRVAVEKLHGRPGKDWKNVRYELHVLLILLLGFAGWGR